MSAIVEHSQATLEKAHHGVIEDENLQEKYLSFSLSDETFGINILAIKEIIEYINVAKVPMVPDFIKGVINLRGNVVPIICLARRLKKADQDVNRRTCIVIVEVQAEGEQMDIGIIVDSVNEVLDINSSDIEPTPAFGASVATEFIRGMGRVGKDFIVLLDMQQVLNIDELADFNGSSQANTEIRAL